MSGKISMSGDKLYIDSQDGRSALLQSGGGDEAGLEVYIIGEDEPEDSGASPSFPGAYDGYGMIMLNHF